LQAGKEGVYVNLNSGAVIGKIISGDSANGFGDVVISADGSLIPLAVAAGDANVTGSNITIDTAMGSIGSLVNPFVISANQSSLANGGTSGGVVNLSAPMDIGVTQIAGDLLVDQIKSTADGNILINVPNGNIYNASGQTAAQALSRDQAEKVWRTLGLTEADGAETGKATDATVVKFESLVDWYYNQYWQLRNLGTVASDGTLTLSDAGVQMMTAQAAAALNIPNPTADQVRTYANQLYQSDCNFLSIVAAGGVPNASPDRAGNVVTPVNLNEISDYTTYNKDFHYTATSEQISALTANAVWTVDELTAAISRTALLPSSSTPVGNTTPNIVGRDVTINTGNAIGKLVDPVAISLTDFQNKTLTDGQKAALALAKSPGDVVGIGTDSEGKIVTFSFEVVDGKLTVPEGYTLTGLQLSQTAPVYVDATGKIKASASQKGRKDAVYLQASGVSQNFVIDQITTGGDIYLTAPQNITVAVNNNGDLLSTYQLQGDNIRLVSGSGNIGSAETPLIYQADGALILATAGQDIYLKNANGDMKIGGVAAGGTAWLESESGSILPLYSSGVAVQGDNIYLQADNNIGSSTNPLTVQLSGNGTLSGQAGGAITLASPSGTLALTITDLTAENDIWLDGEADIILKNAITANNGSIIINALKNVTISGTVQTSNSLDSVTIYGATITEGGAGLIRTAQLTALSSNGQTLIGTNAVDSFNATNSNGGDILFNNTAGTLTLTGISQENGGNVAINNTGAIAVTGTVATTGNVNLTASEAITESSSGQIIDAALLTTQSKGGQSLTGANTVNAFNATNAGGGNIELTNTDEALKLIAISQTDGGNVTLNNTGTIAVTGTVATTGNVNLIASETITESGAGRVINAAVLTTQSTGGQTLTGANTVKAFNATNSGSGEIQLINSAAELALTGISQKDGGNVVINNTGAIAVTGTVATTGNVNLTASEAITESSSGQIIDAALLTTQSTGGQTLTGANMVNAFNATNTGGGDIKLINTAEALNIEDIRQTAGGNVTVNNTGDINVKTVTVAAGNINLTASESIFNRLGNTDVNITANTINLKAENGQIGEESIRLRVYAKETVNAAAAGDVYLEGCNGDLVSYSMSSQNGFVDLITANGNIIIDKVNAPRLSFTLSRPGDTLQLDTINVIDSINVKADNIQFGQMIHSGSSPLHLSISGGSKEMADYVTINITSELGAVFDKLHTDQGRINAQTDNLDFYNTVVGDRVEFYNKYYAVLADNNYVRLEDFDAQPYPENTPFYLSLRSDRLILTDAYIVNYDPDFIINRPDIRNSFVREAMMNLPMVASSAIEQIPNHLLTSASVNGSENYIVFAPGNLEIGNDTDQNGQVIIDQEIVTE
ncbi:MAG TPA: hypothetical protein VIM29_10485, partial [Bacillota bacterium]